MELRGRVGRVVRLRGPEGKNVSEPERCQMRWGHTHVWAVQVCATGWGRVFEVSDP